MDRFSVWMVRTSLVHLLAGLGLGGVLLANVGLGVPLRLPPLGTAHAHLLFVGWLLQFALGIAYWLLPRRRSADNPLAYSEPLAFLAYALLNIGLIGRVIGEPLVAAGVMVVGWLLVLSAALQTVAGAIFVAQLWRRARGRSPS
jgi:hypothetical protein